MLCDCDCEHPSHPTYEDKSPQCSLLGTLQCGVCNCIDGHFGKECECPRHDSEGKFNSGFDKHSYSCRPDNASLVDCSGRGTCACGVCECDKRKNNEAEVSFKRVFQNLMVNMLMY